jgi:hypothetical protein
MERLTAQDRLMLWPDELWPQDIGGLAVIRGSLDLARQAAHRHGATVNDVLWPSAPRACTGCSASG